MSLTDRQLSAIAKLDAYNGVSELADGEGLIARVSPLAKITFQYRCRFNGKNSRFKIGKYPAISLKEARQIHKRMMELRERGRNPEIALTGETDFVSLDDCVQYWLDHKVVNLKKGTQEYYRSFAKNYYFNVFPDRDVQRITAREWVQWFDTISKDKPKTANSAFSKLRTCFNYCKAKFLIENTALERIRQRDIGMPPEEGERVLHWRELARIWLSIERSQASTQNKALHQLTMLWGNRLSELRLARRHHFDLQAGIWTVPKEISKMGNIIRRPIPPHVQVILERLFTAYDDVIFPGSRLDTSITISAANRYIRRLRDSLPLEHWRTHDFRRSLSTGTSELGVMPHVVEKMLGHELAGVMSVYNKHDWLDEQLDAYNQFYDRLVEAIEAEKKSEAA